MCCPAVEDGEYGVHRDQLRLKPYAMTVRVSGGHYDVTRCIQKDGLYSRIYQIEKIYSYCSQRRI